MQTEKLKSNEIGIHTRFSGELAFQVWSADSLDEEGNPLPNAIPNRETPFQPQIITDAFFETWLNGTTYSRNVFFSWLGCGSGTLAATASDTTISQIGTRLSRYTPGYTHTVVSNTMTTTSEYRSTQGQIIGTISEVGLFQNQTGGQTMMRSLIKDVGGAPTTLTLTAMDFLYVKWRVSTTVNLSDTTGIINISGTNYNYTMRPANWNVDLPSGGAGANFFSAISNGADVNSGFYTDGPRAYSTQTLGSVTSRPGGTDLPGSLLSTNSYTAGSKQRKMTYRWNITQGNTGSGIGSIQLCPAVSASLAGYQISFAAVSGGGTIPKDNTKEFTMGITYSFGR
jgi:hypothetical protein